MHESIWSSALGQTSQNILDGDIKTQVAVVGGGLAGILTAHFLKQAGIDCVVLEADRVGAGITKNSTAKITSQHGAIYYNLTKDVSKEAAAQYYRANQQALSVYREMCKPMECDFLDADNYVFSRTDRESMEREAEAAQAIGAEAEFTEHTELPFAVAGAVKFPNQAQFHVIKFLNAAVNGLTVYEHTMAKKIEDGCVYTNRGKVAADAIVVATHFPILNSKGMYFAKMYQQRSYVLALNQVPPLSGMYIDQAQNGHSFRSYGDFLLLGGESHRTGKQSGAYDALKRAANTLYPDAKIAYEWSTQDCMTLDKIPYIGRYSRQDDNLYVATGFNKWGMTSSMAVALLLKDLICGKENEFATLFDPHRGMLKKQLAINLGESVKNLLTPTPRRCPHLGCALKWNPQEHSWDCPCHGSRFGEDGRIIDNPALHSAKVK